MDKKGDKMNAYGLPMAYGSDTFATRLDKVDRDAAYRAQLRREERRAELRLDRHPFARVALVWQEGE